MSCLGNLIHPQHLWVIEGELLHVEIRPYLSCFWIEYEVFCIPRFSLLSKE